MIAMVLALAACGRSEGGNDDEFQHPAGLGNAAQSAERSPATNYALFCQGCHLPDGSGMTGKVPDMRGQLALMLSVPEGREYVVQVPGTASSPLEDKQTAELLNWLIAEMGPNGVDFTPYDEAEIGRLRHARTASVVDLRRRVVARVTNKAPARPDVPTMGEAR